MFEAGKTVITIILAFPNKNSILCCSKDVLFHCQEHEINLFGNVGNNKVEDFNSTELRSFSCLEKVVFKINIKLISFIKWN
jgi:hypothetical protein